MEEMTPEEYATYLASLSRIERVQRANALEDCLEDKLVG